MVFRGGSEVVPVQGDRVDGFLAFVCHEEAEVSVVDSESP